MAGATHQRTIARGAGPTAALLDFAHRLRWRDLDGEVRHEAKRHLLDTLGVMIAGGAGDVASKADAVLTTIRPAGGAVPVPGRARRVDRLDAAWLGGTGAHGIELDDGYREGSVHPGVAVVPALLSAAYGEKVSGERLLEAMVAGYEAVTAIARASHPMARQRGFHPTGIVGSLGAALATARLLDLSRVRAANALGLAASASAGLFAFLAGGGDVKRLHAGHAAREGLTAALLARGGVEGPPDVLEGPDGFFQAFPGDADRVAANFKLPPDAPFGVVDCYFKPYACCRHLQPAVEAMMTLCRDHGLVEQDIQRIDVETYAIATSHAETGWGDFASAQLSFPFIMALGLRYGRIDLKHFEDDIRADAGLAEACKLVHVRTAADLDAMYPSRRPARVKLVTTKGEFSREAFEAIGSRDLPLDDDGLARKFTDLVAPVRGQDTAERLLAALRHIESTPDVSVLLDLAALPAA